MRRPVQMQTNYSAACQSIEEKECTDRMLRCALRIALHSAMRLSLPIVFSNSAQTFLHLHLTKDQLPADVLEHPPLIAAWLTCAEVQTKQAANRLRRPASLPCLRVWMQLPIMR